MSSDLSSPESNITEGQGDTPLQPAADKTSEPTASSVPAPVVGSAPEPASSSAAPAVVPETAATEQSSPAVSSEQPVVAPGDGSDVSAVESSTATPESPAVAAAADVTAAPEAAAERPRVQLNPRVDVEQAKPVPSDAAVAVDTPVTDEAGAVVEQPVRPPAPSEPVDLPPADVESIDADLEAELVAAMETEQTPAAVQTTESTEAPTPGSEEDIEEGTKLKGKIVSVQAENVLLEVGFRASGVVPTRQFEGRDAPTVGAEIDVVVVRYDATEGLILLSLPRATRPVGNWDEVSVDQIVDCVVVKTNKGGLEVTVSNLRGFLPASQVDLGYVSDLKPYVGQKLRVKITEVKPEKRNLVVSRRSLLEEERAESAAQIWVALDVGQQHRGTVKTIKDYGAFVDIGGVDGLLHVGELSWTRVNHPKDVLSEGQTVDVKIVALDREKSKIGLSMKQLTEDPWTDTINRFPVNSVITGRVTNTAAFGAFVEISDGVEGLIHISEIDHRRINKVTDVLTVGEEVQAQILSIDPDRKRIGLSLKSLKDAPEPEQKSAAAEVAEVSPEELAAAEERRKHLKGGTSSGGGGLLFGNPGSR